MDIESFYNKTIVYLSPHLDDLVLSNGGFVRLLNHQFKQFINITVFSKSKWAPMGNSLNAEKISNIRKTEDIGYCSKFGLDYMHLDYDDSSLRGYDDDSELHSLSYCDPITQVVQKEMRALIWKKTFDIIFCPLSIGSHIDHAILFDIISQEKDSRVIYYEDLPYAAHFSPSQIKEKIKNLPLVYEEYCFSIKQVLQEKVMDIYLYKSQLEDGLVENTILYSKYLNYSERLWIAQERRDGLC